MTLVFDAEPLLAFLLGEPGGDRVQLLLERAERKRERACSSRVNLAEVMFRLARRNRAAARTVVDGLLERGLEPFPCAAVWEGAARIKAEHAALSLADAFAAATAHALSADLVIGGDEDLAAACAAERIRVRRV